MLPWTEKYRPKTRSDLFGNEVAINSLYLFLKKWNRASSNPAILLIGPPGCGKTSSAYVVANDLNYVITEVNASDTRSKITLQNTLRFTTQFERLDSDSTQQLILMDEVDGISGRNDRGGLTEFIKLLKETRVPIICTANDPESDKIIDLIKKTKMRSLVFERADELEIFDILIKIVKLEKLAFDETNLQIIAESASGDIRAAINELQSFYFGSDVYSLEKRDKQVVLLELFTRLFKSKNMLDARSVWSNAPSDYSFLLLTLFDIAYKQCSSSNDLYMTYEQLALADLTLTRIMRTQDYSLLRHFFNFIGPGLFLSRKKAVYSKITKIDSYPSGFRLRGIAKNKNKRAILLSEKASPKLHISKSYFVREEYNYASQILLGKKGAEIAAWLDLDDDEIESLMKIDTKSKLSDEMEAARIRVGERRILDGEKTSSNSFLLDSVFLEHDGQIDESEDNEKEDSDQTNTEMDNDESQSSLDDFF